MVVFAGKIEDFHRVTAIMRQVYGSCESGAQAVPPA
jgi:hypothetical protein